MFFVGIALLSSCGQNDTAQPEKEEKGKVEQMTDRAAKAAVKQLRTPLDKAQQAQQMGKDRLEAMDKALRENR